jgi:hypothetical protein
VRNDARARRLLDEAVLHTLRVHGFTGKVVDLPEGDEIEVPCAPKVPIRGARFFLRAELSRTAKARRGKEAAPQASVPTGLLRAWRGVPEPVAVVGLDPATGAGRLAEVHPFLAWLDRTHRGWEKSGSVLIPLPHPVDGPTIPRLARAAADAHVLYRRVMADLARGGRRDDPRDHGAALSAVRELDFDLSVACLDLLREAGLVEESEERELRTTEACTAAFSRAAVRHSLGGRAHADPATAALAGRSAVVRVLQSRLPDVAESTLARCAVVLARFLPVEDADAILDLAKDPDALSRVLGGDAGEDE